MTRVVYSLYVLYVCACWKTPVRMREEPLRIIAIRSWDTVRRAIARVIVAPISGTVMTGSHAI